MTDDSTYLVIGGTGKTGRRVIDRLGARGLGGRVGSRPPCSRESSTAATPTRPTT